MNLTLYPYALTAKQGEMMFFLDEGAEDARVYRFTAEQTALLQRLADGEFLPEEEIRAALSDEVTDELLSLGRLTAEKVDTSSMDSRTAAFCAAHDMADAPDMLRQKSVMILGCGGIGTHMAWHMIAMGVGKLTLVDFDLVEESNLNRQILFDRDDIGAVKADALREKLLRIRPDADVRVVRCRVDSVETLERLAVAESYDLLVKALDSPAAFPVWLDAVCKKHLIPYVAGITLRDQALIGPTFLPGSSEIGWSDLIPTQGGAEKLWGTAPSMGLLLYRIADELAIESFKVLTGKGNLRYVGCIRAENVFTNEVQMIGKRAPGGEERGATLPAEPSTRAQGVFSGSAVAALVTLVLAVFGVAVSRTMFVPALLLGTLLPHLTSTRGSARTKAVFSNTLLVMLCVLISAVLQLPGGGLPERLLHLLPCLAAASIAPLAAAGVTALCQAKRKRANLEENSRIDQ